MMAQTERAANQGPAELRLENYGFVNDNSQKYFRNFLREVFEILSKRLFQNNFM